MTKNTKTIAQRIFEIKDYNEAMDEAVEISCSDEQDWEKGTSEFTFEDNSVIKFDVYDKGIVE